MQSENFKAFGFKTAQQWTSFREQFPGAAGQLLALPIQKLSTDELKYEVNQIYSLYAIRINELFEDDAVTPAPTSMRAKLDAIVAESYRAARKRTRYDDDDEDDEEETEEDQFIEDDDARNEELLLLQDQIASLVKDNEEAQRLLKTKVEEAARIERLLNKEKKARASVQRDLQTANNTIDKQTREIKRLRLHIEDLVQTNMDVERKLHDVQQHF